MIVSIVAVEQDYNLIKIGGNSVKVGRYYNNVCGKIVIFAVAIKGCQKGCCL